MTVPGNLYTPTIRKTRAGGYAVDNSAVFNKADAEYFAADSGFGTPSNADVGTLSVWFKRGNLGGSNLRLFTHGSGPSVQIQAYLTSSNTLVVGNGTEVTTTQVFRDPHAWYHLVVRVDTSQGTDTNRIRHYLNGSQITDFSASSYPSQNANVFTSTGWRIGSWSNSTTHTFDGYMSEVVYCDGQSLGPTSFGETDTNGVWRPIDVSGLTFGNNGFYLNMAASGSDLSDDASGNSNDFTNTNSVTQSSDSPTNNHCVMSPIDKSSAITTSAGNLTVTNPSSGSWNHGRGSLFVSSGKWYYEWTPTAGTYALAGWMLDVSGNDYVEEETDVATTYYRGVDSGGAGFRIADGATDASVTLFGLNDVVMMAIDVDTMKMWVGINGTWYNSGDPANGTNPVGTWTAAIGESLAPWYGCINTTSETFNFGATSFAYTPPTGFNAWNTTNLVSASAPAIEDPDDHFKEVIVDHDGSSTNFTIPWSTYNGTSGTYDTLFSIKRLADEKWFVIDSIRGLNKYFSWNATTSQTTDANVLSVSGTTGTLGSTLANDNYLVQMYRLNAQSSRDTSNSEGSITGGSNSLIISANATAGWSVCTYTGTGANGTFGHGLSQAPEWIRWYNTVSADGQTVYHAFNPSTPKDHYGNFDSAPTTLTNDDSTKFNDTAPTADVNSVGSADSTNGSSDAMWCFSVHSVNSFSKVGAFVGNGGADGPFVEASISPKSVVLKNANGSATGDDWYLVTDTRFLYNGDASTLAFNLTATEQATNLFDMVSNGIKLRTTNAGVNENTNTIVYQIIGSPFAGTTPATAR